MNPTDHVVPCPPQGKEPTADVASVENLARDTGEYVRAWTSLLASESRLARISLVRLAFAALIIPALALGICVALDALLVTLLHRWLSDWSICVAVVLCADFAGLFILLFAMRRWWRNLSLPRSRNALTHLLERMA